MVLDNRICVLRIGKRRNTLHHRKHNGGCHRIVVSSCLDRDLAVGNRLRRRTRNHTGFRVQLQSSRQRARLDGIVAASTLDARNQSHRLILRLDELRLHIVEMRDSISNGNGNLDFGITNIIRRLDSQHRNRCFGCRTGNLTTVFIQHQALGQGTANKGDAVHFTTSS